MTRYERNFCSRLSNKIVKGDSIGFASAWITKVMIRDARMHNIYPGSESVSYMS